MRRLTGSRSSGALQLLGVAVAVLAQEPAHKPTFVDVTESAGIDFRYTFGDFTYDNILESSGSGVTVFDYDGDGDLDLYLLNGTYLEDISDPKGRVFRDTPNRLYRNNGDGTFTDVARQAGVDDRHWSMAAEVFDYDGDGDQDLYLLNYGPNVFYRNNGDGTFTDMAKSLGLQGPETLNGFTKWSVGAVFWDYDLDRDVDLMVCNFLAFDPYYLSPTRPDLMPHPSAYQGQASLLYRRESNGTFTEVTRETGLYFPESKCMGLTVFDYDDDGDLDLFQANDHQKNFLFRNDGKANFEEVGETSGVALNDQGLPAGSMHGSIGDVDGDGLIDLLVVDLEHGALYRNLGNGLFEDVSARSGLRDIFEGLGVWAAAFLDYDNDGDLDIFSTNGMADLIVDQPPLLLENDGSGHFRNVGMRRASYFRGRRSGRGAAVWDFDNDGDLDILVSHIDLKGTPTLLKNEGGNQNHWLAMTLVGVESPAAAVGAKVTLVAGAHRQVAVNQPANSYLSSNDPRIFFGLGGRKRVDRVEVRWGDGSLDVLHDLAADRFITFKQGRPAR